MLTDCVDLLLVYLLKHTYTAALPLAIPQSLIVVIKLDV